MIDARTGQQRRADRLTEARVLSAATRMIAGKGYRREMWAINAMLRFERLGWTACEVEPRAGGAYYVVTGHRPVRAVAEELAGTKMARGVTPAGAKLGPGIRW